MMPIHVPQYESAKQARRLSALTYDFVESAHTIVVVAAVLSRNALRRRSSFSNIHAQNFAIAAVKSCVGPRAQRTAMRERCVAKYPCSKGSR